MNIHIGLNEILWTFAVLLGLNSIWGLRILFKFKEIDRDFGEFSDLVGKDMSQAKEDIKSHQNHISKLNASNSEMVSFTTDIESRVTSIEQRIESDE